MKYVTAGLLAIGMSNAWAFKECVHVVGNAQLAKPSTKNDLCYSEFGVRYNQKANGPDFSIMVLKPSEQNNTKRTDNWRNDPRVSGAPLVMFPKPDQNKFPSVVSFDKGHLTPADLMTTVAGMSESFFMTNQAPQFPGCNRGMWRKYEMDIAKYATRVNESITVITGVQYGQLSVDGSPSIPTHYWKLVVNGDKMFAFVLPNDPIQCSPKTSVGVSYSPITYQELTEFLGYKLLK